MHVTLTHAELDELLAGDPAADLQQARARIADLEHTVASLQLALAELAPDADAESDAPTSSPASAALSLALLRLMSRNGRLHHA